MSTQHIVVLDEVGEVGGLIESAARGLDARCLVVHDFNALGRVLDEAADIAVAVVVVDRLDPFNLERLAVVNEEVPALQIVLVTSQGPNEVLRAGVCDAAGLLQLTARSGASDVLTYPLDSNRLIEALQRSMSTAAALRGWARRSVEGSPRSLGAVHAVTGARGGAGRTFFAINLAAHLALVPGAEVCIVDLDVPLGSVALATGLRPRFTMAELLELELGDELASSIESYCETHERGFSVLAAPIGDRALSLSIDDALAVVRAAQRRFTHVVVDLPLATNNLAIAVMRQATDVWCVLKADLASLRTHGSVISNLDRLGMDATSLKAVLNMVEDVGGISADDVDRVLPHGLAAALPYTRKAGQATNSGSTILDVDPNGTLARRLQVLFAPYVGTGVATAMAAAPRESRFRRMRRTSR